MSKAVEHDLKYHLTSWRFILFFASPQLGALIRQELLGAVVLRFNFNDDDVVFIGDGSCGIAALESVAVAGAIAIMLRSEDDWFSRANGWVIPTREHMMFDAGRVSKSRDRLAALARLSYDQRVFLAGDIPRETTFRAPPIERVKHAIADAAPRQLQRLAFCEMCLAYGFVPESLHKVVQPPDAEARRALAPAPNGTFGADIATQRADFARRVAGGRAVGQRPGIDFVASSRDSAIVTEAMPYRGSMLVRRWAECPFDTAFLDRDLVERYAHTSVRHLFAEPDVLLFDRTDLAARAAMLGMTLHAFDTRLD